MLGSFAAGDESTILTEHRSSLIATIGRCLLDMACSADLDLRVAAEALDSLFDVFQGDHTEPIALELRLVERLQTMVPSFKHRVHAQRRSLGPRHLAVVVTAKDNLLRFIKYKVKYRAVH